MGQERIELQDRDAEHGSEADHAALRSYGRRRGRPLSARQQALMDGVLPRLALDLSQPPPQPLSGLFGTRAGVIETWLEIGFGGAEHLLWQAERNPQAGIIGCEPFVDGVVKALDGIEARQLGNVRLHADDARAVLAWLPDASIARAFILFPDPWPKARHRKRRLVSSATLAALARVMRPGAELRVGTDIGDYARTILIAFQAELAFRWLAEHPDDWRVRPADWPETRYERKAITAGRRCAYLRFVRE